MIRNAAGAIAMLLILVSLRADAQNFRDDFNSLVLGSSWSWVREDRSSWNLTGTQLEITTQRGALNGTEFNSVKNLLLRPITDSSFVIETKLTFTPNDIYHNAGLVYYIDDDNYIRVSRGWSEFINGLWFEYEVGGVVSFDFNPIVQETTVWLRLERKAIGGEWKFASTYSLNGVNWEYISFARKVDLPFVGAQVGLQAANGDGTLATSERIPAQFDYFAMSNVTSVDGPGKAAIRPEILTISPNPVRSGRATAILTARAAMDVTVTVVDMLGRTVLTQVQNLASGESRSVALPVGQLPSGTYRVIAASAQGTSMRPLHIVR